jgi:hypothetical protein
MVTYSICKGERRTDHDPIATVTLACAKELRSANTRGHKSIDIHKSTNKPMVGVFQITN